MTTALVHDYLLVMRGAERTFARIADCWADAPIYTTLYDEAGTGGRFANRDIRTSYLSIFRVGQAGFRRLLPFFPRAVERLPVGGYDVVVSSSSAFAHGVRPDADAVHVCYCHTPFRYAWHERDQAVEEIGGSLGYASFYALRRIRGWDLEASKRVTRYVANGEATRRRIADLYGRDSIVIHPPVDVARFAGDGSPEDWLLIVCELVAHKRVDRALEAARLAGRRVKVVGSGPELPEWRARFGDHAEFLGRVDDRELEDLYRRASALVVPNVEEFGIAAVEAQAAGTPVLAVDAGGARETVVEGETGVLVAPRGRSGVEVQALAEAMREVDFTRFDRDAARRNAERFAPSEFERKLLAVVEDARRDR